MRLPRWARARPCVRLALLGTLLAPARAAAAPAPAATTEPSRADAATADDGRPLAGYHGGLFFLRDRRDDFHLYIQGRGQLDWYSRFGPKAKTADLHPTLFVRRIRSEISGEILGRWRFMIAGDFGATAIDNADGTREAAAAPPGVEPTGTNARYAPAATTRFHAAASDVFVNYRAGAPFNVMVGQMDAPFTMENRTSDKYLPFMERSLAVRAVGVPANKELGAMVWGQTEDALFYYSAGPYMGDGQNRPNVDSRLDVYARTFVHPLVRSSLAETNPLRRAQVGASFHYGSRDRRSVTYDYLPMTTQGAFPFWTPVYRGTSGFTHVIPAKDQVAVAAELRVPFERFDVTGEVVWISNDTREALEGLQAVRTERQGRMEGLAYYATLGYWLLGRRDVIGAPGYGNPPRLDWSRPDPVKPNQALQVVLKWEQVALDYRSALRSGVADPRGIDGPIRVNALSLGANYWATRHVRLTLDHVINVFPSRGAEPAFALHELLGRVGIAL